MEYNNKRDLLCAIERIDSWIEKNSWSGWDPFDIRGMYLLKRIDRLPSNFPSRVLKKIVFSLLDMNPLYARKLMRIKPEINAKGMGLFLSSYCDLFLAIGNKGYLEKVGLSNLEARNIALKGSSTGWMGSSGAHSYLEKVDNYRQRVGIKIAKPNAATTILLGFLMSDVTKEEAFLYMKAHIAVVSYQVGDDSNFDQQIKIFSAWVASEKIKEACKEILEDAKAMSDLKEQFIKSKTIGSRKGTWSKIFG